MRSRSSQILAPSVYRGPNDQPAIALTFDDGPSESTPALIDILHQHGVPATFFQCGVNIRRLPSIARLVASTGHEIGNHSDTHPCFPFHAPALALGEFSRAQQTAEEITGTRPVFLRAPFGARWFGFREMQRRLGLRGVMWTVIGRDWVLDAKAISRRIVRSVRNGSIVCLHDGRELQRRPNICHTLHAVREIIPALQDGGYRFESLSDLLCPHP